MFQPNPRNDPFAPTYNPGWKNHPNFSWNQGQNHHSQPSSYQNPPFQKQNPSSSHPPQNFIHNQAPVHPPGFNDSDKRLNSLEKSLDALLKSTTNLAQSQ